MKAKYISSFEIREQNPIVMFLTGYLQWKYHILISLDSYRLSAEKQKTMDDLKDFFFYGSMHLSIMSHKILLLLPNNSRRLWTTFHLLNEKPLMTEYIIVSSIGITFI